MKGKVKTIIIIILLSALCILGVYAAISSAVTLSALLASKNGFVDSFWTVELAIGAVCLSVIVAAAAAFGIFGYLLKRKFMYISFILLLAGNIVFCFWCLIGGNMISEGLFAALFIIGALASVVGIAACIIKLLKKKND